MSGARRCGRGSGPGLQGRERGAEPRGAQGADRQRVIVGVEAAQQDVTKRPERSALGKGCDPQAGDPALGAQHDANLENPRRLLFQVVFGVPDTRAGAAGCVA